MGDDIKQLNNAMNTFLREEPSHEFTMFKAVVRDWLEQIGVEEWRIVSLTDVEYAEMEQSMKKYYATVVFKPDLIPDHLEGYR